MEINFQQLKDKVITILEKQINGTLSYHNVGHTKEVLSNLERIAKLEGINDERTLLIMKLAALFHDTGFIYVYHDHEEKSCEFAKEALKKDGKDLLGFFMDITEDPQDLLVVVLNFSEQDSCALTSCACTHLSLLHSHCWT